ncbi:MAG: LLM class flavin-dependent oxidoreductase [Acidimicrobiales bacterium]
MPRGDAMRFGITFAVTGGHKPVDEQFQEHVSQIQVAEECGFDSAFVSEHHFIGDFVSSPLVALAYIAAKTSTIRLGTGLTLLPLHDPVRLAEDSAVLDVVSGGRLIMGIGQGYRPEEFAGFHRRLEDRRGLMREGAILLRKLWTERKVTFEGEHFQTDGLSLSPAPIQKPPPIWVGAKAKRAIELAAEIGDCWYADPITPLDLITERKVAWLAALAEHGKDPADQDLAYYREFHVGDDDEKAWDVGGRAITGEYMAYLRFNHLTDKAGKAIPADRTDLVEGVVRDRCTVGGPAAVIDDLHAVKDALDPTDMILKMSYGGMTNEQVHDAIRLTADQVIPAVA